MKTYSKIIAGALAVLMSAGATGMYAMANEKKDKENAVSASGAATDSSAKPSADANGKTYKQETVYVMTNASGSNEKVIVSDWLKNPKGLTELKDTSKLSDIENTKTDDTFDRSGDNIVWKTNGGDIYYKGNYSGELPFEMKITYTLDGKQVKPDDLLGKSGKVTIRYEFVNKTSQSVTVNGKQHNVRIPFVMTTGSILDTEIFSNVSVTNGKIISDGSKQIFIGVAVSGIKQSIDALKSSSDPADKTKLKDIDIPEFIELSADVRNFEMPTVLTLATNDLFSEIDLDASEILSEAEKKLNEATDGADKLTKGAKDLHTGTSQLKNSVGELTSGIDKLYTGSVTLSDGLKTVNDGAKILSDGANALNSSTGTLTGGVGALKTGSQELTSGLGEVCVGAGKLTQGTNAAVNGFNQIDQKLPELKTGAAQLKEGAQQLTDAAAQLYDGSNRLTTGLEAAQQGISQLQTGASSISDSLSAQSDKKVKGTLAGTAQEVSQGAAQVYGELNKINTGFGELTNNAKQLGKGIDTAAANLGSTISANEQALAALTKAEQENPSQELTTCIQTLKKTITEQKQILASLKSSSNAKDPTVRDGLDQLEKYAGTFQTGVKTLTDSTKTLSAGAAQLSAGTDKLLGETTDAVKNLSSGINTLKDKFSEKGSGILDGSKTLSNGLLTFGKSSESLNSGIGDVAAGVGQLESGIGQLESGAKQIDGSTSQLSGALEKLHSGAQQLTGSLSQLGSGSDKLNSSVTLLTEKIGELSIATAKLYTGSTDLKNGIVALRSASPKLSTGVKQLDDGAAELESAMNKFKQQAVDKIKAVYQDDLKSLFDEFSAITKTSDSYNNFSGIADDTDGEVKFVFQTQAIRKDD